MIKLLTVPQMQALEKEASENGISYAEMMERAGKGIAQWIYDGYENGLVLGLVGTGNNGGDTLIALETLAAKGWPCKAYLPKARATEDPLLARATLAGVEIVTHHNAQDLETLDAWLGEAAVLLDGILGTGAQLPLKKEIVLVLNRIQTHDTHFDVIAIDCPSGVDCSTGATAPETLPAAVTLCIEAIKTGLLALPAFQYVGQMHIVPLNLPTELKSWPSPTRFVISDQMAHDLLPIRPDDAHKGTFGTALIAAGSINYTGAAYLAAKAAARIGTGLIQLAVPGPLHIALAGSLPDITWHILPHQMGVISADAADVILKVVNKANALLLGPGWGQEDTTAEFLKRLLQSSQKASPKRGIGFVILDDETQPESAHPLPPLVVDADALKLLAQIPDWADLLPPETILTPHPGEMAALTGLTVEAIQADRAGIASQFAQKWQHVVILKGAFTVIAAPNGQTAILPLATAALAHAGSGDVLAGILVGLRAQGLSAVDAAIAGTWVHGQAGLAAADHFGNTASVLASDVLEAIADVL